MPAEVYSTQKPASPVRAWATSILLLAAAVTLANSMSRSGLGMGVFGERIEPEGWDIAFRPPANFRPVESSPELFSSTYSFEYSGREGLTVALTFWRLHALDGTTALDVCREVLNHSKSWLTILFGPPRTRTEARIGERPGVEIHDPAIPMIVRAVVLENGWSYAVSFRLHGALFDESLYRLFDLTCHTVQFKSVSRESVG